MVDAFSDVVGNPFREVETNARRSADGQTGWGTMTGDQLHDVWRHGEDMLALCVFLIVARSAIVAAIREFFG